MMPHRFEMSRCISRIIASSTRQFHHQQQQPTGDEVAIYCYLGRRFIYSHHIRNSKKKKLLRLWANELGLGGWYKWGYPGIVVIEGCDNKCDEYVKLVKSLRWRYITVQGEERVAIPDGQCIDVYRVLPNSLTKGPDSVVQLATMLNDCGVKFDNGGCCFIKMYTSQHHSGVNDSKKGRKK